MTDFKSRMDQLFQRKVIGNLEKTVSAVALVVDSTLAATTPVKTGRARAGWMPTLNIPSSDIPPKSATGELNSVLREENVSNILPSYKITDTIYLTNNLPYIQKLNEGSSIQAPKMFIEAAIERGKRLIQ